MLDSIEEAYRMMIQRAKGVKLNNYEKRRLKWVLALMQVQNRGTNETFSEKIVTAFECLEELSMKLGLDHTVDLLQEFSDFVKKVCK